MEAARHVTKRGYDAVIFRRTTPEIKMGGGLWPKSAEIYPLANGTPREHALEWTFPAGAKIAFRHLEHEKDKLAHQGGQYAFIGWDELTHFTETQFWYLMSRNRSTSGVRPYQRATCNPDPDSFVRRLIAWWIGDDGYPIQERSGVIRWFVKVSDEILWADNPDELAQYCEVGVAPKSLTFIPAKLEDNPALLAIDPGYKGNLASLNYVERMQLKEGNWDVRPAAGLYFQRGYFGTLEERPPDRLVAARVRAWDKAATKATPQNPDPDWTRGVLMAQLKDGRIVVEHVESLRGSPAQVELAIRNTAEQDGRHVRVALWQDPGQAGVVDIDNMRKVLAGFRVEVVKASRDKVTYAGPLSSQAEGGNVQLVRGPWNDPYLSELEGFPEAAHDDQVDASSLAYMRLVDRPRYEYHRVESKSPFSKAKGMY